MIRKKIPKPKLTKQRAVNRPKSEIMAQRKIAAEFAEATGKTVKWIKYEENADWQALEITFSDDTLFSLEFSARVTVKAGYLKARVGNLKMIHNYGRISGRNRE